MKIFKILAMFAALSVLLTGCLKDDCSAKRTYKQYIPQFKTLPQLRSEVALEPARAIKASGKIWFYGHYLLLNEPKEGIHIIDNTNPSNPINTGFLKIPGNVDMAVKDGYMYADCYTQLLVFDMNNPRQPRMVQFLPNVFQYNQYVVSDSLGLLIGYKEREVTEVVSCQSNAYRNGWMFICGDVPMRDFANFTNTMASSSSSSAGSSGPPSVGGSMARFTLANGYLYCLDGSSMIPVNLSSPSSPTLAPPVNVSWTIETLFAASDSTVFIGSQRGVYIYDVTNPASPRLRSEFTHANSCDPVVVQGNRAYVTLRGGTPCNSFTNQLDVLDVSDLDHPTLIRTYPMINPHGLSIRGNSLAICEGASGIKFLDATDDNNILERSHLTGFNGYDVIFVPETNVAMVTGSDGIYQFDFTNLSAPRQLSFLPVTP